MIKLLAVSWDGAKAKPVVPFGVNRPTFMQITNMLSDMNVALYIGKYGVVINGNGEWFVKWNDNKITDVSTAVADHALLVKKKGGYDYDPRKVTITRDDRVVRKPVRKR